MKNIVRVNIYQNILVNFLRMESKTLLNRNVNNDVFPISKIENFSHNSPIFNQLLSAHKKQTGIFTIFLIYKSNTQQIFWELRKYLGVFEKDSIGLEKKGNQFASNDLGRHSSDLDRHWETLGWN